MICSHSSMFGKPGKDPVDVDKNGRLYAQKLSEYKYVHSWAGHSHINFNKVYSKSGENRLSNIEGHIVARATEALWLNEWVCSDGTPRGYYVVDVDGEKIEWHYHPCGNQLGVSNGLGDDYQMRVYSPSDGLMRNRCLTLVSGLNSSLARLPGFELLRSQHSLYALS